MISFLSLLRRRILEKMSYGTIDRINEDGIIFSVAYKEGDKDVAFKKLVATQGGNLTFVSSTQNEDVVEDGSEIVLTSKNAFDESVATSIRDAMVNTYVNYTDANGLPEQKGDARKPVYITGNGKATACSILKEPTSGSAGSAGVVSVAGAPKLELDTSKTISRPTLLSSLVENGAWIAPMSITEVDNFVNSLFP